MSESTPAQATGYLAAQTLASSGTARLAIIALLIVAAIAGIWWFVRYQTPRKYLEDINDAQVQVEPVIMAPRVSGYVGEVLAQDNQDVKAGTPSVRIRIQGDLAKVRLLVPGLSVTATVDTIGAKGELDL